MSNQGRRVIVTVGCAFGLVLLYFALPLRDSWGWGDVARLLVSVAVLSATAYLIWSQIRSQATAEIEQPVAGLVLTLVAGVLVFALADFLVAVNFPGEFVGLRTRMDALYFALTTLATVGYGDVHAQGQGARALIAVQLVFNLVVIATGASVLSRRVADKVRRRRNSGR